MPGTPMVGLETPKGVVLVLMPIGRDAQRWSSYPKGWLTSRGLQHPSGSDGDLEWVIEVVLWRRRRSTAIMPAFCRTGWPVSHRGTINPLSY